MLLEAIEAAQAMNVDEKTVVHWIRKENLPAEIIQGEYSINSVDLLEWATSRGMQVSPSLYTINTADDRPLPTLSQALIAGGIHFHVTGNTMESVLTNVVKLLELPPEVDPDFILQILLARETMGTVTVGDGIAIPHVRNPILVQLPIPKISLCYLENPIDFDAIDGIPVKILFTIISPTIRMHLHLLSRLAYCLSDPRLKTILEIKSNPTAIINCIIEIERDLVGAGT